MSFKINYSESSLSKKLDELGPKMGAMILMYAATKASKIESNMKTGRLWIDRSGAAKARLSAKVSQPDLTTVRITLAHGVEYGIWLELAHEKKNAIIAPTIRDESPRIITDLDNLMSKIKL